MFNVNDKQIMKKTLAILSAMLMLVACGNDKLSIETSSQELQETGGFKVDLTINRADATDTKAYVKCFFATNDVVFIFFSGVSSPKYLEAKYAGAGNWTFTAKNGLTAADLEGAVTKKMTAVYMPYGSDLTVSASGSAFNFNKMYLGYILKAQKIDYTISSGVLSGTLELVAPTLETGEKWIHFDVSGYTNGHDYELCQDYVKPCYLNYINDLGEVFFDETSMAVGSSIVGYKDGGYITFSGVLTSAAVGNELDYQFTIVDRTAKIIYTRDAGVKTLNDSKFIGLGTISDASVWNATEYVDLGLPSGTLWAKCNLGADTETGYGDFYAWGETTPYYSSQSPLTWKDGKTSGYAWNSYTYNPTHDGRTFTKYTGRDYDVLQSMDDAATANLKGLLRMPTHDDFDELLNSSNCDRSWVTNYNSTGVNGYLFTSKRGGYTGRSIFLPAAGFSVDTNLYPFDSGNYWSSSLYVDYTPDAYGFAFDESTPAELTWVDRWYGMSIRPVCKLP